VNCAGCCDRLGVCHSGVASTFCGSGGNACLGCASTQVCSFSQCVTPGGTDGGGGDAGALRPFDAGMACPTLVLSATRQVAAYSNLGPIYENTRGMMQLLGDPFNRPDAAGFDELDFEHWWFGDAGIPHTEVFGAGGRWRDCTGCVTYWQDCVLDGGAHYFSGNRCPGPRFFAQAGTLIISAASRTRDGGVIAGSVSGVVLQEWNFYADTPVAGARCVTVPDTTFSISY
jgi:hypothetical protein